MMQFYLAPATDNKKPHGEFEWRDYWIVPIHGSKQEILATISLNGPQAAYLGKQLEEGGKYHANECYKASQGIVEDE